MLLLLLGSWHRLAAGSRAQAAAHQPATSSPQASRRSGGAGAPGQVSKGEHEAESVCGDVHGGQDGGLKPQRVQHIQRLGGGSWENGARRLGGWRVGYELAAGWDCCMKLK